MERMKRVSVFFLVVLISGLITGCDSEPKEPGRYYNNSKGFSIKFPDGWSDKKPEAGILVQVSNPEISAQIGVQVQEIPEEKTLDDAFKFMLTMMQRQGGQIISQGEADISGNNSRWFTCRYRNEKLLEYLIKKENYLYAIIFTSDLDKFTDDFENEMREVAGSFRFE